MLKTSGFVVRSIDELKKRITGETAFRPTLAFIFSSVKLGIPDLVQAITPFGIPVFGSTSAGEILAAPQGSPVYEQSAVCCLLDMPPGCFSVKLFDRKDEPAHEFGERIGRWGALQFSKPSFIISIANLENNGEAIVRAMEGVCPNGTRIFGGFGGDSSVPKKPVAFSSSELTYDGAIVIVFDLAKVSVEGVTTMGWTGVGADMVVTRSEGSMVYTINGHPALDVIERYLNVDDKEILPVSINFPLLLKRPDGTELLRTVFAADFTGRSVKFAGNIPQGSKVRFSSSFGRETIDTAIRDLKDYYPRQPEADLLLMFSCLARHRAAGPMVDDEIMASYNLWKCPLVGLFACGEIGPNRVGTCELYNESISLILIHVRTDTA
jgi:hypothetical protein